MLKDKNSFVAIVFLLLISIISLAGLVGIAKELRQKARATAVSK